MLEIVDQRETGAKVALPGLRDVELGQQSAAAGAEQITHRALMPERQQRGMYPVLQARAVLDQMQPKTRQLSLTAELFVGQPDRRHEIA
jgi:hypothetical protein